MSWRLESQGGRSDAEGKAGMGCSVVDLPEIWKTYQRCFSERVLIRSGIFDRLLEVAAKCCKSESEQRIEVEEEGER